MTPDELRTLADTLKDAPASDQHELLATAFDALLGPRRVDKGGMTRWHDQWFRFSKMLAAEAYESAALMLLPKSAGNLNFFDYGGASKWGCRFNDRAQQMGKRAASEQIARMLVGHPTMNRLRGEPRIELEDAIAEHWLEFHSIGAETAGLAIAVACLHCKATLIDQSNTEE